MIGRYIWKCPYKNCDGKAKQEQSRGKALRYGRYHLKRIHNDRNSEPLVEKVD